MFKEPVEVKNNDFFRIWIIHVELVHTIKNSTNS